MCIRLVAVGAINIISQQIEKKKYRTRPSLSFRSCPIGIILLVPGLTLTTTIFEHVQEGIMEVYASYRGKLE